MIREVSDDPHSPAFDLGEQGAEILETGFGCA